MEEWVVGLVVGTGAALLALAAAARFAVRVLLRILLVAGLGAAAAWAAWSYLGG